MADNNSKKAATAEVDVHQLVADRTPAAQPGPAGQPADRLGVHRLEPVPAVDRVAAALHLRRVRAQRHAVALDPPGLRDLPGLPGLSGVPALAAQPCPGARLGVRYCRRGLCQLPVRVLPRAGHAPGPADHAGPGGLGHGIVLLLEATRRALGLPMVIVAIVFLGYTFGGPYMPDMIAHKGASISRVMSHQWLTTEGVFGVALGVSSGFIFLFVLFGACSTRPAPATTSSSRPSRCSATCAAGRPRRPWCRRRPPASLAARRSPTW
jgi:hypothetical protein